eukprot:m.163552 g.163552  ORF g.163552 m.163552 type:complete len:978 (-) comp16553_c0_seq1:59-2992(-)
MDTMAGAEELMLPVFPDPEGILKDDPKFYQELDDVVQQADLSYLVLERLLLATSSLADATERYRQAILATTTALNAASKEFRALNAQDERPLHTMADMLSDLESCFSTSLAQLEASCNSGLSDSINKFRTMFDYKSQLNQAHLKYTSTMTRFCSTGFGENGIVSDEFHRRSHKAYAARKNAHLIAADCTSMLVETLALEKINVMQMVLQGLFAQVAFFQQGAEQIGQHDAKMGQMHDMLQNMRYKAQAAVDLENDQVEAVKTAAVARHAQEVALIPEAAEKNSHFAATLKRVVTRSANTSGRRRRGAGSAKWRTKSKKEKSNMTGFGASEQSVDDDTPAATVNSHGLPQAVDVEVITAKQGYLFRRHKDKRWKLESFVICDLNLCRMGDDGQIQPLANLLLSTVKMHPEAERHHVFEVVTPNENLMLQSLGPQEFGEWIAALHAGIAAALDQGNADKKDAGVRVDPVGYLSVVDGNDSCADCGNEEVEWASINLGIVLCINCSGVHRSVGVHISKVRSILLDRWSTDLLEFMQSRGNARVNARYEANLPEGVKPVKNTPDAERAVYIRAKYSEKAFEDPTVELSPEYQEKPGSTPSRNPSLPSAPESVLAQAVKAQRDVSPSRRTAPTPPGHVSPRRFADHQPPNLDFKPETMSNHRTSTRRLSTSIQQDAASLASSSRQSSEVVLPGFKGRRVSGTTLSSLPQLPEVVALQNTERIGSSGLFDNLAGVDMEDMELEDLVSSAPRKPRRSSMMSSMIPDSTERLLLEPYADEALMTQIAERTEETDEETGEETHELLEDEPKLARATATRRKAVRPRRKSRPGLTASTLALANGTPLQAQMTTSARSSASSVFDDVAEIICNSNFDPDSSTGPPDNSPSPLQESVAVERRVTTPRMLKRMTFDDALSDGSMARSRSASPKEEGRYNKRNGVMIASVTKASHNTPTSLKEGNNSSSTSRNDVLLAIHTRNSQGSATAL